ncbi:rod shape-determining protein RodA [Aquabacterium sp.]|uniref:rod shape-determining protein RodA n=1 Tax=Aquabacterium sp. TaxID=1872578 RepID=UPI00261D681D|nr:rod shape-determining protein RodA [Aquabacterium sp.]MDD2976237.1 rod shape-determining protein RodA [Aquabacterium sp.]
MNVAFARPSWWQRLAPIFQGFDLPFVGIIVFMCLLGLVNMYSVGFDHGTRFIEHGRNMMLGAMILFVVAQVPPQRLMALAVPLYTVGVVLLVATALFGITKKGATRWLNIGIVIQPSELIKIATPLMLAWWFQRREGQLRGLDYAAAGGLLLLPVGLVLKQPDLGTSLLVLSGGLYVIFFAGLSWRLILPVLIAGVVGISLIVGFQDTLCEGDKDWVVLHGYQKQRVCTLLNPTADPLGKGFHIIQGMIAIGSGGITGKGFMQGTQTHLEFIPERTTDFAFAGYAEEHGLIGALVLMGGFLALIFRGLYIASQAPTLFVRLLAGSLALSFFTYAFVNLGMVSGILPVVGVPLPFISYGGTAMVTLGLALGLLLSISRSRGLMQR